MAIPFVTFVPPCLCVRPFTKPLVNLAGQAGKCASEDEKLDMDRFKNLGVIKNQPTFETRISELRAADSWT